ncbi:MAG: hypothetical protein F9B45_01400 [Phycisphaera sp. RhM]|nr:hypothetical protein [Phycisphaera sp. RhM]
MKTLSLPAAATGLVALLIAASITHAEDRIPQGFRVLVNLDGQNPRALVSCSPTSTTPQLLAISNGLRNAGVSEVLISTKNHNEFNHPTTHHLAVAFENERAVLLMTDRVPAKLSQAILSSLGKLSGGTEVKSELFELFADQR